MTDNALRLAKRVAETIPCSRGEAERYIAGGWVSVDGTVVEDPAERVNDDQEVTVHPDATLEDVAPVTILLHKPPAYHAGAGAEGTAATELLTAASNVPDHIGRQRVLRRHFTKLTLATPLDTAATGLVVYSQDFHVNRKLVEEADRIEHEYIVETSGRIRDGGLAHINGALNFKGRPTVPVKVSWQNETRLRVAGKGIRPGQIDFLCAAVGLTVVAVKRIRIGRIPLASLPVGQWRYLGEFERF